MLEDLTTWPEVNEGEWIFVEVERKDKAQIINFYADVNRLILIDTTFMDLTKEYAIKQIVQQPFF